METPQSIKDSIAKLPPELRPLAEAVWPFLWAYGESKFDALFAGVIATPASSSIFSENLANLIASNAAMAAIKAEHLATDKAIHDWIVAVIRAAITAGFSALLAKVDD